MGWEDRASSLRLDVDDEVARQNLYAERGDGAEKTSHDGDPCWQVVSLVWAEDKAIEYHEC